MEWKGAFVEQMKRFAVYYAPPPGPLADLGAHWLGRDPATGATLPHPTLPGLPRPVADLTRTPRKYGLHGTFKPPFRLADGQTPQTLHVACADLASRLAPVEMAGLALTRLGGFLALTPLGDVAALAALSAAVVQGLEAWRAPLTPAEIARRRPERLTPRQRALLDLWGYPYVMEEFRFHLTLTDDLPEAEAAVTARILAAHLTPALPAPFAVRSICLFGETAEGLFHLLHRYPLSG
ncbi:MAG: DUF1045 domain-containing protein [Paracoccaceae bacterium]|nr:DUF1045 domain-containing protein [Paracoccaceae bacterium]